MGDSHVVIAPAPQQPFLSHLSACSRWPQFLPAWEHFAGVRQALFLSVTFFSVFSDAWSQF